MSVDSRNEGRVYFNGDIFYRWGRDENGRWQTFAVFPQCEKETRHG